MDYFSYQKIKGVNMVLKKGIETLVGVAIGGEAIKTIGNTFTGSLKGIGQAAQVGVGASILGNIFKK